MSMEGIVLEPGQAPGVELRGTRIDYLVGANRSEHCSVFEFTVAPGFDTGAHYHTKIEEVFYVLEGELNLRCGDRVVRAGVGACAFVPPGLTHAFGNAGTAPARILVIASPPGHEKYFDELAVLVSKGGPPEPETLAALRAKYDTIQVSGLVSR
jgi:mannose-6-phosphate isomerase-like protein (cupin superfamily)